MQAVGMPADGSLPLGVYHLDLHVPIVQRRRAEQSNRSSPNDEHLCRPLLALHASNLPGRASRLHGA